MYRQITTLFGFTRWYAKQLDAYPLATKSLTTGAITTCGDLISQIIQSKNQDSFSSSSSTKQNQTPVNFKRAATAFVYGAGICGPFLHGWYQLMFRLFPGKPTLPRIVKQVAIDQSTLAPFFGAVYIGFTDLRNGVPPSQTIQTMPKRLYDILSVSIQIWPAAQVINYSFIPLQYRVLASNTVSLGWNVYLASVVNKSSSKSKSISNDEVSSSSSSTSSSTSRDQEEEKEEQSISNTNQISTVHVTN
eukprot:gb/GECH01000378.1/.p1 GENE.gb/GECH01000378.1/~~gb/GECH01000378.1/.p1  ORF type:complete len:247 (+),score=69.52 gb/GECH01000378.1/:1-741(+)